MKLDDLTLDVEQHIEIKAAPDKVFPALLHNLRKRNTKPDGDALGLDLDAKPHGPCVQRALRAVAARNAAHVARWPTHDQRTVGCVSTPGRVRGDEACRRAAQGRIGANARGRTATREFAEFYAYPADL